MSCAKILQIHKEQIYEEMTHTAQKEKIKTKKYIDYEINRNCIKITEKEKYVFISWPILRLLCIFRCDDSV